MEESVPNSKLRRARERQNWKQKDVADRIGATPLTVGRWERGTTFPSAYFRQQLCDLFEMTPEALGFIEKDEQNTTTQEKQAPDAQNNGASGTRESKEEQPQEADEAISHHPQQRRRFFTYVAYLLLPLTVLIGTIISKMHFFDTPPVRPGGGWISPVGETVGDVIHFAAYAYPTNKGDPEIDHVNFTMHWQGVDPRKWIIACVAYKPIKQDVFACTTNLRALGVPRGKIMVSFDVYDMQGNMNLAPNGVHTFTYVPS